MNELLILYMSGSKLYGYDTEESDLDLKGISETENHNRTSIYDSNKLCHTMIMSKGIFEEKLAKGSPYAIEFLFAKDLNYYSNSWFDYRESLLGYLNRENIISGFLDFIFSRKTLIDYAHNQDPYSKRRAVKILSEVMRVRDNLVSYLETGDIEYPIKSYGDIGYLLSNYKNLSSDVLIGTYHSLLIDLGSKELV